MAKPTGFHVCPDFEPVAFARNSELLTYCRNSPCRHGAMMHSGGAAGIMHAGQRESVEKHDNDNHESKGGDENPPIDSPLVHCDHLVSAAQTSSSLREMGSGHATRRSATHSCCARRSAASDHTDASCTMHAHHAYRHLCRRLLLQSLRPLSACSAERKYLRGPMKALVRNEQAAEHLLPIAYICAR